MKNKVNVILPLAVFMAVFYMIDALRIYTHTNYRLVIWFIPTFLFIRFFLHKDPIDYLKLRSNIQRGIAWGVIVSCIHALVYVAYWYLKNGVVIVDWSVGMKRFLDVVILAGLIEEIVFRGLALGYLRTVYSFKTANITSSLLFTIAHIPYFMVFGYFSLPILTLMYEFARLFTFGLLWGFLLKKTNSLWPCMIHHSVNNFLAFMVK